jgi:hypothetical protein
MSDHEKAQLELQVWTKIISTQEHFNQMILNVRNHFLTIVAAVIGAAALTYQRNLTVSVFGFNANVASLLLLSALIIVVAFYVTEAGYYHMLVGAVEHAQRVENILAANLSVMGLTESIKAGSHARILFRRMDSTSRMRAFYGILGVLFTVAAIVSFWAAPESRGASPTAPVQAPKVSVPAATTAYVPNDPSAGTKSLKKFYHSGAYLAVFDNVIKAAEHYADEHAVGLDRSKAVAIFDVDDTSLSTWEILESGEFTWDAQRFNAFVEGGKGKRLEPALRMFAKLKSLGVPVVFLTSREERLRSVTEKNLNSEGFAGFAELVMKPDGARVSTRDFKDAAREKIKSSGRTIFLSLGDHMEDLDAPQTAGNFLVPDPFY